MCSLLKEAARNFNPRSPHGERHRNCFPAHPVRNFNPRSPHGERLNPHMAIFDEIHISIHAPRTGSDRGNGRTSFASSYFNPRSPHGERLGLHQRGIRRVYFNPRSPHGERLGTQSRTSCDCRFQSTLPARGATRGCRKPVRMVDISIHAPRTGSDTGSASAWAQTVRFQSTLPARGATTVCWTSTARALFQSTLPARGATGGGVLLVSLEIFQSTLPARGATTTEPFSRYSPDFNPRSPHGERLLPGVRLGQASGFQSTLPARGATHESR